MATKKDSYIVFVRAAGARPLGSVPAKSLAEARSLAISAAAQLPVVPLSRDLRVASTEIGRSEGHGAYMILAMFVPKADGVAEYENEIWAMDDEYKKIHPRPKKLAIVLPPGVVAAAAKSMAGKKRRGSRRARR